MISEMQVLERLQQILARDLGQHVDTEKFSGPLDEKNILIDYPDVDKMPKNTMFYIQPDYESLEELSMGSDLATMHATVFILCKGAASRILIQRVFALWSALYVLARSNQSLDGFIDSLRITDMDYYPAVTASATITAIEARMQMQWAKQF